MRTARDDLVLEMPSFGNSDITFFPLVLLIQTRFVPRSASSSWFFYKNSYQMFGTLTTREEY